LHAQYGGNEPHPSSNEDHWKFLNDGTGNILSEDNIRNFTRANDLKVVNLVTADGSVDCSSNPNEQEERVASLHLAEIVAGLLTLGKGRLAQSM